MAPLNGTLRVVAERLLVPILVGAGSAYMSIQLLTYRVDRLEQDATSVASILKDMDHRLDGVFTHSDADALRRELLAEIEKRRVGRSGG